MTVYLAPDPINSMQFIPGGVIPAAGGKLFSYLAGSTTKTNVYTDNTGGVAWSNPIILDSGGNLGGSNEVWIPAGVSVKFVLAPFNDTDPPIAPYKTWDSMSGINDATSILTEWIPGPTPTFVSTTSFTLVGDQTANFTPGRRVKTTNTAGTRYGMITASVFTTLTTLTVTNDSGNLDAGLSAVFYSILNSVNTAVPYSRYNFSDANGYAILLILNDVTSPSLSGAAAIFNHRPTGTLPNNRTGDGVEGIGAAVGTITNSSSGYVLSGVEASAVVASNGGLIPSVWALHTNATITGSTNVTDLVSGYFQAPTITGTGTAINAYGIIIENVNAIGTGTNLTLWSKGNSRIDGTLAVNGLATHTVGAGNTAAFYSGTSTGFSYLDIGRAASDVRYAVAGAPNDFISGSAQGDALLFTLATKSLILGTNQARALSIDSSQNVSFVTSVAFNNQTAVVGASTATLTNSPHSGNPTIWPRININGSTFCFPCFLTT